MATTEKKKMTKAEEKAHYAALALKYDVEWFVSVKMAEKTGRKNHDYQVEIKGDKIYATREFEIRKEGTPATVTTFDMAEAVAWKKEMDKPKTKKLGEFQITGSDVVVSDPCYGDDVWCKGELHNVQSGTWEAEIRTGAEGRVAKLYVNLKGFKRGRIWEEAGFTVGVDSGQAGVWDKSCYRTHQAENESLISSHWKSMVEREEKDEKGSGVFYATACSLTCGDDNGATQKAGVMKGGAVSSTGYGDGSYTCYFQKDKRGFISAICIQFM